MRDERHLHCDERPCARVIESVHPNPVLVTETSALMPGTALDVACGGGANTIWPADRGWRVTAVEQGTAPARFRWIRGKMSTSHAGVIHG